MAQVLPAPRVWLAAIPIALLLGTLLVLVCVCGADIVSTVSPYVLLATAAVAFGLAWPAGCVTREGMRYGFGRSAGQILPAVPLLAAIGLVSATWMLGGVVPTLIVYGLKCLNAPLFPALACAVCAVVSVLTGSSWTTIATVGVAFMGIGRVMGYSDGWIAGAIISGAYFGDKVSPLSDTTVVASGTCGVDLFRHIRYMMLSSIPAMALALAVFAAVGIFGHRATSAATDTVLLDGLHRTFNITAWTLLVPALTFVLIIMRVKTLKVLLASSAMGFVCMFATQPQVAAAINPVMSLVTSTSLHTGSDMLDSLVQTGGIMGMMPTIMLVLCAMTFGAVMIGTGMLRSLSTAFTRSLKKRTGIVGATVGTGLMLNSCTADQYLSIIIGANMYGEVYRRFGLENRVLSRTLEDSVSVTSVLIPWNSCGVTQSTVLGVATLTYLPFCIFNIASPLMSLVLAWTGWGIKPPHTAHQSRQ